MAAGGGDPQVAGSPAYGRQYLLRQQRGRLAAKKRPFRLHLRLHLHPGEALKPIY